MSDTHAPDRSHPRRSARTVSRRSLLRGLGVGAAAAALPSFGAVFAQDDAGAAGGLPAGLGVLRTTAGDVPLDILQAASFQFDAATIAANAEAAAVEELLAGVNVPLPLPAAVDVPLLRPEGGPVTMIDAGTAGSSLPAALAAVGLGVEDVERLVISHWHPDHLGGAVADGAAAYPNATVFFPEAELAFLEEAGAEGDGGPATALQQARTLQDAGAFETYGDGDEVAPGVEAVAAFGHTPGQHAFLIGGEALHLVDSAANATVSLSRPEWAFGFDADPQAAAETRRRLLQRAADEGLLVLATHFAFPGLGYVSVDGDGFRFVPSS